MSLLDAMLWLDRVIRRPERLAEGLAQGGAIAHALESIDPNRLQAVHCSFAQLVVSRWWQPRFPAVLATLTHFCGGPLQAARRLYASPAFEDAVDEDVTGAAFVGAVLELADDASLETPEWLSDLLAYEYLIGTGLPRRVRGEPPCSVTEALLLPDAAWLEGGRLATRVLLCPFEWPVSTLQEEPYDAEPDPHSLVFVLSEAGALELEAGDMLADAVELLAGGASDQVITDALGEDAGEVLAQLVEHGLLSASRP